MFNLWRKIQRQFFTYSRSDRNAVILLAGILLFLILANQLLPLLRSKPPNDYSELEKIIEAWEREQALVNAEPELTLFPFDPNVITREQLDKLDLPYLIRQNILSYRNSGGKFDSADDINKIYGMNDSIFARIKNYVKIEHAQPEPMPAKPKAEVTRYIAPFDPNSVVVDSLLRYGFSRFQSGNLLKYRENGGVFHSPEDLLKIYGMDTAFYLSIKEYVRIEPVLPVQKKILRIDLNSADTSELMQLPGIGSVYASRIIKYRELLGGYYTTDQLLEVYGFSEAIYDRISDQVFADTVKLNKLRINFFDYAELIRHPYLNKQQVLELINHRDVSGVYKKPEDIKLLESFDTESFMQIRPYVTCR